MVTALAHNCRRTLAGSGSRASPDGGAGRTRGAAVQGRSRNPSKTFALEMAVGRLQRRSCLGQAVSSPRRREDCGRACFESGWKNGCFLSGAGPFAFSGHRDIFRAPCVLARWAPWPSSRANHVLPGRAGARGLTEHGVLRSEREWARLRGIPKWPMSRSTPRHGISVDILDYCSPWDDAGPIINPLLWPPDNSWAASAKHPRQGALWKGSQLRSRHRDQFEEKTGRCSTMGAVPARRSMSPKHKIGVSGDSPPKKPVGVKRGNRRKRSRFAAPPWHGSTGHARTPGFSNRFGIKGILGHGR